MLADLPLPNVPGAGTNDNFMAPRINPINQDLGAVRIDYVLSDATRISAITLASRETRSRMFRHLES